MSLLHLTIPLGQGQDLILPILMLYYPLGSYLASGPRICWQHFTFLWSWLFCYEGIYIKVDTARLVWHLQSMGRFRKMCFLPSPTLWQIRLVMRFWCFFMYFHWPLCRRWRSGFLHDVRVYFNLLYLKEL